MTAPAPARRTPRREATRGKLMDAAAAVCAEVGIGAASVETIAERAGFTRGAFYSNFATKEELLLATVEREFGQWLDALEERLATLQLHPGVFDSDELGALLVTVLSAPEEDPTWHRVVLEFRLLALRDPQVAVAAREQSARMCARVTEILDLALDRLGRRRALGPQDTLAVLQGTFEAVLTTVLLEGADLSGLAARMRAPMLAAIRAVTRTD